MSGGLEVLALDPLPEVSEGDGLGALIAGAAARTGLELADGDIVVVSHKVVSKSEGRIRDKRTVEPGTEARRIAAETDRDPRLVELILADSRRVVRATRAALIVETSSGWICANAGHRRIERRRRRNRRPAPRRPRRLGPSPARRSSRRRRAPGPGIVIADSFGRPWRRGQTEVAIGCAGVVAVDDWRGRADAEGRALAATAIAVADQLASAADLARAKDSRQPVAVVRGAERFRTDEDGPGAAAGAPARRRRRPLPLARRRVVLVLGVREVVLVDRQVRPALDRELGRLVGAPR